jgi:Acetyltransferase (GNAT) family
MKQLLGLGLTALGAVGGAAQILNMGWRWAVPTLLIASLCALIGLLLLYRSKGGSLVAVTSLRRALGNVPPSKMVVRRVSTEAELREVSELDAVAYGQDGITFEALRTWWKCYPRGVWALWADGRCVGGIGFWPMKIGPFRELTRGRRTEAEITANAFDRSPQRAHWYIGGIFLQRKYQGTGAVLDLLRTAVSEWAASGDLTVQVEVAAIASSDDGEKLLRRFGFHMSASARESVHRHSVFLMPMTAPQALVLLTEAKHSRSRGEA